MTSVALRGGTRSLTAHLLSALPAAAAACLCLMVALEYSGGFGVLAPWFPVSLFSGVLAVSGIVALLRLVWAPTAVPWTPLLATIGYLGAETISYVRSGLSPAVTGGEITETLKLVIYVAVICILAADLQTWHRVALAIVAPMALISLLAVVNQFVLGNAHSFLGFETVTDYLGVGVTTARHAGPLPDPNFWGRFLVIGLPFCLALGQRAWSAGRRRGVSASAAAFALLLCGVYLTGSRGAFVAAGVAVVVHLLCVGVRPARLLLGIPAAALLLLVPGVGSRLLAILPVPGTTQMAAGDESVASRLATQEVAWAMAKQHPLSGVGPGGYFDAFGQYAARSDAPIDRVIAPHDLYLGLWAQVGLIGLIAFCGILLVGLVLSGRTLWATRGMATRDAQQTRPYAAAIFAGTLAWCVASIFLHLTYARVLLLLVVLAAAMWQQARRVRQVRPTRPSTAEVHRAGHALVGAGLGVAVALTAVALAPQPAVATRTAVVTPVQTHGALGTYLASLRTRTGIVPSYAVLVDASSPRPVDAQGDVRSGTVTVRATGPDAAAATADVSSAIRSGGATVRRVGMDEVFTLQWQPGTRVSERKTSTTALVGLGLAGAMAGAAGGLGIWRLRHRRDRGPGGRRQ